jgi:hypothetical protein
VADSIGNVYITGYFGPSFGPYDIITIKYNPGGVQQWLKIYDSGGNDECRDIAMDKTGNVYIGGFSDNQSLIIKYNLNGDTVWTRKYGETNYRFPGINLILDNQNNIYISGARIHTTNNSQAQFTVKYDSNAVFKWINNPLVNQMISSTKLGADNSGNIFVTGQSFSGKILTIKYDSNGNEVWQRIYDGPGSSGDLPFDLKIDGLGNIIVTGASNGIGTGNYDFVTVKYNSLGDSLWVNRYNGSSNENDESYSLGIDDSNNVYITGRSKNASTTWNYVTIKYGQNGVLQWNVIYNGPPGNGEDIPFVLRLDKQKNIFVSGISDRGGFLYDYTTIKYSQLVNIYPISTNIPGNYKLEQNYPNPFNPNTKIRYQIINNNTYVRLYIYDIMGKEITKLVNEKQNAGFYEVAIDAGELASGIYFYKLITEKFTEAKKMVLIK